MEPVKYDLEGFRRGDTFRRRTFVPKDEFGDPVSFPGATVSAQLRVAANAPEPLLSFTAGVDGDGYPYIEATAEQTAAVGPISRAVWDLQVTYGGETDTWIEGDVPIGQDVTR